MSKNELLDDWEPEENQTSPPIRPEGTSQKKTTILPFMIVVILISVIKVSFWDNSEEATPIIIRQTPKERDSIQAILLEKIGNIKARQ
jgi:hypothetical protein